MAKGRKVFSDASDYHLREQTAAYLPNFNAKNSDIEDKNTYFWNISSYNSIKFKDSFIGQIDKSLNVEYNY